MTRLLVAGSYPPVPGPAATATVAAVCRGWEDGREVEVVSPRPSAAHRTARLVGLRAAKELAGLRRETGADELVLSIESGMPFARGPKCLRHRAEAMALARAFAGYSRVTVVMTSNIDVSAASLATLWPRVHQVVTVSEEESRRLAQGLGVPAALITVDRRRPRSSEANDDGSLITPAGPPEWEWSEQPRRLASLTARKLLGRRAPGVRATLISLMSTVRRRLTGIVPGPERPSETE